MTETRISRFILYSSLFHAVILLVVPFFVRSPSGPRQLFTEVSVVGAMPQGRSLVPHPLKPDLNPPPVPDRSASRPSIAVRAKRNASASAADRKKALRQKIRELEKSDQRAPIGVQSAGIADADLADPAADDPVQGDAVTGVPDGTEISGPIAQRKIRHSYTPEYPAWARQQGVVTSVSLQVCVLPNGTVDLSTRVQKTSGYKELDQLALQSMLQWTFEPLPAAAPQAKQWGSVIFYFHLQ